MDFRLGPWLVQPELCSLIRGSRSSHLSPKTMDVLVCLARHSGEVVPKSQIFQEVWPDTFVTDDSLVRCISELRHALEDDAHEPSIVQTIAKRGYRVVAPVTWDAPSPATAEASPPRIAWWKRRRLVTVTGLVVALATMIAAGVRWLPAIRQAGRPAIQSIAVLPLADLSGDPRQEYYADGITEELITALSQVSSLRVISRTSVMRYKGTTKRLPEIARELGVDAVVEGTVLRSGNHVRVTAQLINAATDYHLWSASIQREAGEVLLLQDGIARAIADEVHAHVNPQQRARGSRVRKVVTEAYEAYLKGWYFYSRDQFAKAAAEFEHATVKDPEFALAYALLSEAEGMACFYRDEPPSARVLRAAEKARELDSSLAEVHTAAGDSKFFLDWDWEAGLAEYRRATEIDPGSVDAALHYELGLHILRRWDAAIEEAKRAVQLDPLSPRTHRQLLTLYVDTHRYDAALEVFHKVVDLDPDNSAAWSELGSIYQAQRREAEAVDAWLKADTLSGLAAEDVQALAAAGHAGGTRGYWTKRLDQLLAEAAKSRVAPFRLAWAYGRAGRKDEAFRFLEAARLERSTHLPWIAARSSWDSLRTDRRFAELLGRMRFPGPVD